MRIRNSLASLFGAFIIGLSTPSVLNAQNNSDERGLYLTPGNILVPLTRDKIFQKDENSFGIGWRPVKYNNFGLYLMANSTLSYSNHISSKRPGIEFGLMYKISVLNNEIYLGTGYLIEFKTKEEKFIDDFFRNYGGIEKRPNTGWGLEGFVIQFGTSFYIK